MPLTGIEIFKLLPKTNCGKCGVPTCLAFAMQLAAGKAHSHQEGVEDSDGPQTIFHSLNAIDSEGAGLGYPRPRGAVLKVRENLKRVNRTNPFPSCPTTVRFLSAAKDEMLIPLIQIRGNE